MTTKTIYANNLIKYDFYNTDENLYKPMYKDTAVSNEEQLIDFKDIYYFENMDQLIHAVKSGVSEPTKLLNLISREVKRFGGDGNIHGWHCCGCCCYRGFG